MPRLIDADVLKEQTTKRNHIWDIVTDSSDRGLTEIIDSLPTTDAVPRQKYEEDMENAFAHGYTDAESEYRKMIADGELVEVVRCKDCIFADTFGNISEPHTPLKCLGIRYGGVYEDWYCEHGERRTDEQT